MDTLRRFSFTKRSLQKTRSELQQCEVDIDIINKRLKEAMSFGDIIVKNSRYINYCEKIQTYYSWLKTVCLIGLKKDKSDAKWSWFDFKREKDVTYYIENESSLYQKIINTWKAVDNNLHVKYYPEIYGWNNIFPYPTLVSYFNPSYHDISYKGHIDIFLTQLWKHKYNINRHVQSGSVVIFNNVSEYLEEIRRCETELCKIKHILDKEYDKLRTDAYEIKLSNLQSKRENLRKSIYSLESELTTIMHDIDSIANYNQSNLLEIDS